MTANGQPYWNSILTVWTIRPSRVLLGAGQHRAVLRRR
jgi:hypothetical protein